MEEMRMTPLIGDCCKTLYSGSYVIIIDIFEHAHLRPRYLILYEYGQTTGVLTEGELIPV